MLNRETIIKELERKKLDSNSFDYLYKSLSESDNLDKLEEYTKRLLDGEPVQYILGEAYFYGNRFIVNKDTLIPRFETELLVDKTKNYIKKYFNRSVDILDIGTGSGVIAIMSSILNLSNVDGIDISLGALSVAKENNSINNTNVNFYYSDVFSNVNKKYDVIISNPPYISNDEKIMELVYNNEPHSALFADNDGLFYYDKILRECYDYLKDEFIIAFEIGESQGDSIKNLAYKYLSNIDVSIEKDYSGRDRFVFIIKKRD